MKARNHLLAITATLLALYTSTAIGQYVDSVESLKNRAIAASPRAKEAFPWLTRAPVDRTVPCCVMTVDAVTAVRNHPGLAASPRMREQFPELSRSAPPSTGPEFTIAPLVEKNTAVLSSPRMREQYPGLSRGITPETGKGGASKLMEPRK